MVRLFIKLLLVVFLFFSFDSTKGQVSSKDNLQFDSLERRWDEGIPLGNGWLGALIWQKGNNVRISLDKVDLWDERPMPKIDQLKFSWVTKQVNKGDMIQYKKLAIRLMICILHLQKFLPPHLNLTVLLLEK